MRYATFKTDYINGLTLKAINPPNELNKIYVLANQWLKPKVTTRRFASTFSMTLDMVDEGDGKGKQMGKKQTEGKKTSDEGNDGTNDNSNKKKDKKHAFIHLQ